MGILEKRDEFLRFKFSRKAQLTIFIIVGLIIIAAIIFLMVVFPKIQSGNLFKIQSPTEYYDSCIKSTLKESLVEVASKGGDLETQNYYQYKGAKYNYLCYTNEYHTKCVMQQPFLYKKYSDEVKQLVTPKAVQCLSDMKKTYEGKGYTITMQSNPEIIMNLTESRILMNVNVEMKIASENEKNYDKISLEYPTQMYDLISIATSILNFEAGFGASETSIYMAYYPDIKVVKIKMEDGTTLYSVSNRKTGEEFRFATRSLAWPPGYFGEGNQKLVTAGGIIPPNA